MSTDLLLRPCAHCNGTGQIHLTPALVGTYGLALLRAMHGETWYRTGDLPLHASGNPATRTQALKRLVGMELIERQRAYAESGGIEYEWRLTDAGRAMRRESEATP